MKKVAVVIVKSPENTQKNYANNFQNFWYQKQTWRRGVFSLLSGDDLTLTLDPLILKFCSTSSVTRLNSVQNMSEIEQSAVELLIIYNIYCPIFKYGAPTTGGFSRDA